MLVRLLYASRSAAEIDEALVAAILERSRRHNAEAGITGVLCHSSPGNVFLQLLEGGRAAVNQLYAGIVRDPRHRDVTLLDYAEITERRFATWRMGRVNLNRVNQGSILRFSEAATLDPFTLSGPSALALLDELMSTAAIVGADAV
jgi:Sensors of blue-light using FAD